MTPIRRDRHAIRLLIPPDVVPILRELQAKQQLTYPGIEDEDVVDLYYGMGPAYHLAFDGRVICDTTAWLGEDIYEVVNAGDAWSHIEISAKLFECPALRTILPKRPPTAVTCHRCKGTGWVAFPSLDDKDFKVVCVLGCDGLGWRIPGVPY